MLILVFGILSFLVCLIFGIVAWVMANSDLRAMAQGQMDPLGEGMTKAGKILSIISIILTIVSVVLALLLLAFGVFAAAAAGAAGAGGP